MGRTARGYMVCSIMLTLTSPTYAAVKPAPAVPALEDGEKQPVHPLCVNALEAPLSPDDTMQERVTITTCQAQHKSIAHAAQTVENARWQHVDLGENGQVRYHVLTANPPYYIVETRYSGGGTSWFSGVYILYKHKNTLRIHRELAFGERHNGGIFATEVSGNQLTITQQMNAITLADWLVVDERLKQKLSDDVQSVLYSFDYGPPIIHLAQTYDITTGRLTPVRIERLEHAILTPPGGADACLLRVLETHTSNGSIPASALSSVRVQFLHECIK